MIRVREVSRHLTSAARSTTTYRNPLLAIAGVTRSRVAVVFLKRKGIYEIATCCDCPRGGQSCVFGVSGGAGWGGSAGGGESPHCSVTVERTDRRRHADGAGGLNQQLDEVLASDTEAPASWATRAQPLHGRRCARPCRILLPSSPALR